MRQLNYIYTKSSPKFLLTRKNVAGDELKNGIVFFLKVLLASDMTQSTVSIKIHCKIRY